MSKPIAYIAGPYTAKTKEQHEENVREACRLGRKCLELGYAPIVPHKNSYEWELDARFTFTDFIEADLALLEHADILVLMSDWTDSNGTQIEVEFAQKNGIPVYSWECVPPAGEIQPNIATLVTQDIAERRRIGIETYNRPLIPFNGRNGLQDAYEEVLDLAQYIKQELLEKAGV